MRVPLTQSARWVPGILVALIFASAAWAVDGVIEINQASVQPRAAFPTPSPVPEVTA